MLKIEKNAYEKMIGHVKQSYPYECCGLLAGYIQGDEKTALGAHPVDNLNKDKPETRYNMDPVGFIRIEKIAAIEGQEIVGIYHSHPDHPPKPSKTDLDNSWPVYSYIIVAIAKGETIEVRNWCLNEAGDEFLAEDYFVVDQV